MGKNQKSAATQQTKTETAAQNAAPQQASAAKPQILKVKQGQKYRGARAAWYERLCQYDGKPVTEFLANVESNRPSNYGARSKHAGQPEPTPGWLRFFVRTGVAELQQP